MSLEEAMHLQATKEAQARKKTCRTPLFSLPLLIQMICSAKCQSPSSKEAKTRIKTKTTTTPSRLPWRIQVAHSSTPRDLEVSLFLSHLDQIFSIQISWEEFRTGTIHKVHNDLKNQRLTKEMLTFSANHLHNMQSRTLLLQCQTCQCLPISDPSLLRAAERCPAEAQ